MLVQVYLLSRPFSRLGHAFALLVFLLTGQSLLLLLQRSPLVLFLPDIALNAEHQKDFLPQFVVQFHVLFSSDDLQGDVHAFQNLIQAFVDLSRQIQWFAQVLLSAVD